MQTALALAWYGVLVLLAGLAVPVVGWLFPDWPDRGRSLAPATAVAVLTVTAYWVGQISFGPHALVAGLVVLAGLSAVALRRGPALSVRPVVAPLAVFTVAFALVLLMRALDPAVGPYAGEQFLDYGLIHAVRRTEMLPPQDIWFAGERLRYYFGGPLLTALLTWLTDTPPRYAYNLMLPTVFATLATAAYGVAAAVAADRDLPARTAGLVGAFLVAFGGPLLTAARGASSYLPRDLVAEYGRVLFVAIRSGLSYPEKVDAARFLNGGDFSYWFGRYAVPDAPNVFPFWTFVNGDLRPHMYAGSFLLLAAGLALAYYRTPADRIRRRQALLFGALPVVGGLLAITNTFDLPAAVGLAWLTVIFADGDPTSVLPSPVATRVRRVESWAADRLPAGARTDGGSQTVGSRWALREVGRALVAALVAVVVAAVAAVWSAPFLLGHTAQNEGIALLGPTSNLGGLLLAWGAFLVAFALAYLPRAVAGWGRSRRIGLAAGLAVGIGATTLAGYPALGLFVPLVVGGWWLYRTGRARGFDVVLVVAGAGLLLFPELAYVAVWPYDPNAPRWNTIYKIAMQVWVFWGVAAAVALVRVFSRARDALAGARSVGDVLRQRRHAVFAVVAACLLVSVAVFPVFAIWTRTDPVLSGEDPDLSIDGAGYLWETRPDQMEAVEWLRTETDGQPAMVSRPTDDAVYTWGEGANLAATFSGVPTLAGWRHAAGYHGLDRYRARVNHTQAIYEGDWAVARNSLAYFEVEYIYVGPAERDEYGQRDFAAKSPAVTVAYENPAVTIYHVNQSALGGDGGA